MTTALFMPQAMRFANNGDYEYLLVVNPTTEVNEQLMEVKQQFYNTHKARVAVKTKPHITIANFLAREEMEETLIRYLQRIAGTQKSFMATCNNYSGFPPHTVYVRIANQRPFKELALALRAIEPYVQGCGYPAVHFVNSAHLSIARRLDEDVYRAAMLDYAQQLFYAQFVVGELVLLRRKNQFDKCKQVMVFKLLPETEDNLQQDAMRFEQPALFF